MTNQLREKIEKFLNYERDADAFHYLLLNPDVLNSDTTQEHFHDICREASQNSVLYSRRIEMYEIIIASLQKGLLQTFHIEPSLFSQEADVEAIMNAALSEVQDPELQARVYEILATYYQYDSQYAKAIAALSQAAYLVHELGLEMEECVILHKMGRTFDSISQFDSAIDSYEQSIHIAQRISASDILKSVRISLGHTLISIGKFPAASEQFELIGTIDNLPDELELQYHTGKGTISRAKGDYKVAIEEFSKALTLSRETSDPLAESNAIGDLGRTYRHMGRINDALECFQRALDLTRAIKHKRNEGSWLGNIGNTFFATEQYREAMDYYEQAIVIAQGVGDKSNEMTWSGNMGGVYLSLGELDKAALYSERAISIARDIGSDIDRARWLGNLSNVFTSKQDFEKARPLLLEAHTIFEGAGSKPDIARISTQLGHISLLNSAYDEAKVFFERAIAIYAEFELHNQVQHVKRLLNDAKKMELQELITAIVFENDPERKMNIVVNNKSRLLTAELEDAFLELLEIFRADSNNREVLIIHRVLLLRCMEIGIDEAFAEFPEKTVYLTNVSNCVLRLISATTLDEKRECVVKNKEYLLCNEALAELDKIGRKLGERTDIQDHIEFNKRLLQDCINGGIDKTFKSRIIITEVQADKVVELIENEAESIELLDQNDEIATLVKTLKSYTWYEDLAQSLKLGRARRDKLLDLMLEFSAADLEGKERILEEHSELLSEEAMGFAQSIVDHARKSPGQKAELAFDMYLSVVRRTREIGIHDALLEMQAAIRFGEQFSTLLHRWQDIGDSVEKLREIAEQIEKLLNGLGRDIDEVSRGLALGSLAGQYDYLFERTSDEVWYEKAQAIYERLFDTFSREHHSLFWAETQYAIGIHYLNASKVDKNRTTATEKAIYHFQQALTEYTIEAHPENRYFALFHLGETYARSYLISRKTEDLYSARDYLEQALGVAETTDNLEKQIHSLQLLSFIYKQYFDGTNDSQGFIETKYYYDRLLGIIDPLKDFPVWAETHINTSDLHTEMYRRNPAADYVREAENNLQAVIECNDINLPETKTMRKVAIRGLAQLNTIILTLEGNESAFEKARECYSKLVEDSSEVAINTQGESLHYDFGNLYKAHHHMTGDRESYERAQTHFLEAMYAVDCQALPDLCREYELSIGGLHFNEFLRTRAEEARKAAEQHYLNALGLYGSEKNTVSCGVANKQLGKIYRLLYEDTGKDSDVEKAQDYYRASLQYFIRTSHQNEWLEIQRELGYLYFRKYDFYDSDLDALTSEEYFRAVLESKEIESETQIGSHHGLGILFSRRFLRSHDLDHAQTAEIHLTSAAELCEHYPVSATTGATIQHSLGILYSRLFQYTRDDIHADKAAYHFSQCIDIRKKLGETANFASTQLNLGLLYVRRFMHNADERDMQFALRTLRTMQSIYHRNVNPVLWALIHTTMGSVYGINYTRTGDKSSLRLALRHYKITIAASYKYDLLSSHILRTSQEFIRLAFREGEWQSILEAYTKLVSSFEMLYALQIYQHDKQEWLEEIQDISLLVGYAIAKTGELSQSVLAIEHGQTRILSEVLGQGAIEALQLRKTHPQLANLFKNTINQLSKSLTKTDDSDAFTNSRLLSLRQLHRDLHSTVTMIRRINGYEEFLEPLKIETLFTEASIIPIAYLVVTTHGSLALLVTSDDNGTTGKIVPIWADDFTLGDLENLLITYDDDEPSGGILLGQIGSTAYLRRDLDSALELIGEKFIAKVAAKLTELNINRIALIPTGLLRLLPLHAAKYSAVSKEGKVEKRYFLDDWTISYAPSASIQYHIRHHSKLLYSNDNITFCGIGNPSDSLDLPNAEQEVRDIAAILAEVKPRTYYRNEAQKEILRKMIADVTHLHFAGHALFLPTNPLQSYLLLGGNEKLTLEEIIMESMFRNVKLVVLSACQTSIYDFQELPNEVIGLPTGFIQAGAQGVIGSLWPVRDEATRWLMVSFYKYYYLDGLSPDAALRAAQIWLRNATKDQFDEIQSSSLRMTENEFQSFLDEYFDDKPFSNPYYWAAFTFTGL